MKSNTLIHHIFSNSFCIKISALCMGYSLWFYTGQLYSSSQWIQVPLCFYNIPEHTRIQAPETVWVELTGKRMHVRTLDINTLAIHVNAQAYTPGKQAYNVTAQDLFLPASIAITACKPAVITITLTVEPIS
jgi:hypothetical protein